MDVPAPIGGVVKGVRVSRSATRSAKAPLILSLETQATGRAGEPCGAAGAPRRPQRQRRSRRACAGGRAARRAAVAPAPAAPRRRRRARRGRLSRRARVAVGAQVRARARRRPRARDGQRARRAASCRRTCRSSSSARCPAPAPAAAPRRRRQRRRRAQPAAVAEGRLRQVRPGRVEAAVAHPEDLRREPRAQLGDDPARHAVRRGRHHRPRGVPRRAQQGEREGRHQGHDARVPDQGVRRRR